MPTTPSRSSSRSRSPPLPPPAPGASPPAAPRASEPRRRRLRPRPRPPPAPAPNHFLRPPSPGTGHASPGGQDPDVSGPAQRVGRHQSGLAHDAARRAPTARVTAPRASAPPPPPPPSDPAASRRILGRRPSATPPFQPSLDEPAEPLVSHELEGDASELFGIDDDDEGWAPPAWVAEAAAKRQSPGRGRGRTPR